MDPVSPHFGSTFFKGGFPKVEWRKENGLSNILSSKLPIGRGEEWSKGLVPFSFKILNIVFI